MMTWIKLERMESKVGSKYNAQFRQRAGLQVRVEYSDVRSNR